MNKAQWNSRNLQAQWRLLAVLAAAGLLKGVVAARLELFGDEAFYWLEGRLLAWAYSDVPPLTPWLIRAGTGLFGDTYFGVRSLAVVAGTALPLLIYRLSAAYLTPARAAAAGALSLGLPLVMILGLLALPDVWINVLWLVVLIQCRRALDGAPWSWLGLGLAAALGLATHYRFAVLLAAVAAFFLFSARGRAALRRPGPWLAAGVAGLGALPSLWFNLAHDYAALGFQLSARHPWSFQPEGLLQPVVQVLVTTPGMFLLLALAALITLRRARTDARWALLAWGGLLPWFTYLLLAPFTDQERVSFHWPLAAYLPLCVALPDAAIALRNRLATRLRIRPAGWIVGALIALGVLAGLALPVKLLEAAARSSGPPPHPVLVEDNLVGWREAAGVLERLRRDHGSGQRLIADHFMLAAELWFELGDGPVYALDHPLNAKHGRARQLAIWGLDEAGLAGDWSRGWLVVEETATKLAQRPRWLRAVCARFPGAELMADRALYGGRKRFLYYRLELGRAGPCDLPAFAYLDAPLPDQRLQGPVTVRGWAFEDQGGVARVEVLVDGVVIGAARYGLPRPGVKALFDGSTDPAHPNVGFEFGFDSGALANGRHWLSLRTTAADGGVREFGPIGVEVAN